MAGDLGPEIIETVVGRAEVQEVFPAGKKDKAARPAGPRRRHPQGPQRPPDARGRDRVEDDDQLAAALQGRHRARWRRPRCGVLLADTNDIKPGDSLEVFEVEERARTL